MKFKNYFRCRRAATSRLLFCLSLAGCCFAQQNKLVVAPPDPIAIKRGETLEAQLKVATIPGFHVNSNTPSMEYLIPLTLTWNDGPLQQKAIHFPQPETIESGADKLSVFSGSFSITTTFTAPKNASPGSTAMTGQIHYQACNNRMCFRPATIDVRVPVNIE